MRPIIICGATVDILASQAYAQTWRGLTVAPENRCSSYSSRDYSYPSSVEARIVESLGGAIYEPYTRTCFDSTTETEREHIVARSEAHDSGMCHETVDRRKEFARDLFNLTLASPGVNRDQKSDKDAAELTFPTPIGVGMRIGSSRSRRSMASPWIRPNETRWNRSCPPANPPRCSFLFALLARTLTSPTLRRDRDGAPARCGPGDSAPRRPQPLRHAGRSGGAFPQLAVGRLTRLQ